LYRFLARHRTARAASAPAKGRFSHLRCVVRAKSRSREQLARFLQIVAHNSTVVQKQAIRESVMEKTTNILTFLEAGIRAESLRQRAIANNTANIQTPGYRRIDVDFERLLEAAMDGRGAVDFDEVVPTFYHPLNTPVKSNGNDVSLEAEVGEMVKNTLRHKAYVRLLGKKYQQIEAAINVK